MSNTHFTGSRRSAGFTLIELMIVVAVIGILAAIAMPMFSDYVTRSKIVDATTRLGDVRTQMEKSFMDNRTYISGGLCGVQTSVIDKINTDPSRNFDITCPLASLTASTYQLQATGIASHGMSGFTYTIDQANVRTSTGPGGKYTSATCWAIRKDGSC